MLKSVVFLLAITVCLAIPATEHEPPMAVASETVPPSMTLVAIPSPPPEEGIVPDQKPEDPDMKTDSTFWWGYRPHYRSYYSYYRPRSYYSYYSYRPYWRWYWW